MRSQNRKETEFEGADNDILTKPSIYHGIHVWVIYLDLPEFFSGKM